MRLVRILVWYGTLVAVGNLLDHIIHQRVTLEDPAMVLGGALALNYLYNLKEKYACATKTTPTK